MGFFFISFFDMANCGSYHCCTVQLNVLDHPADMFFSLTESPWIRAGRQYSVRVRDDERSFSPNLRVFDNDILQDLWTHTDNGTVVRNMTVPQVPAHGVVALLLKDAGDEPAGTEPPCARAEWCMDKNGTMLPW